MMKKIKNETKASLQQGRKHPAGTMLAVDLYANGNFFEAVLKHYGTEKRNKDENLAYMQYLDDKETEGWVDLNIVQVMVLTKENILSLEDSVGETLADDEKGFLGRRLTVLWLDDARYTGTITKTMKDNKNFVFISYDNGDKCWYNLSPESEETSIFEKNKNATNSSTGMKKEEDSSTGKQSNNDPENKKHLTARKDLQKKYPIGSKISVDIYHDGHYHDALVKKYLANANKRQQAKGEQWVYIQFLDKTKTKQWIDLSCIKAIKMSSATTLRLDGLKRGDDKGFLGKRIVVVWPDGNKYRGLATRCAKDNKHFVFLEYDDGDECWCDLQLESEWGFDDDDDDFGSDDEDENNDDKSSDESVEVENSRGKKRRKVNV